MKKEIVRQKMQIHLQKKDWKPAVILDILEQLPNEDVLFGQITDETRFKIF